MEIGAGHFVRLELLTESQISTPFVRDIARMSRNVVARVKTTAEQSTSTSAANAGDPDVVTVFTPNMMEAGITSDEALSKNNFNEVGYFFPSVAIPDEAKSIH